MAPRPNGTTGFAATPAEVSPMRVSEAGLDRFCRAVFAAVGANEETADAATRAMMHGSRLGVDSHGVRLLDHYVRGMEGGRLNAKAVPRILREFGAVAMLDADDGQGAVGAYAGMTHAMRLAEQLGIGAVGVANSSHFGPAGAFALHAAEAGYVGMAFCNSDSFVRLHDGASRFHGTNPIACAVPVHGQRPWLFDMATSAVPYNRVQLYRSQGRMLPEGVASTIEGEDTTDPNLADMLAPLGGEFGFKGAGLGGIAEIFSAIFTGMKLSFDIAPMPGPDFSTPRKLGAFVMAFKPEAFVERSVFDAAMTRYLASLRGSRARAGGKVMAPGDREWAEMERRRAEGIPLDPATVDAFKALSDRLGVALPV